MTLTPIAELLAVELSLPVFTTGRDWDSNTQPFACEAKALTHCRGNVMIVDQPVGGKC